MSQEPRLLLKLLRCPTQQHLAALAAEEPLAAFPRTTLRGRNAWVHSLAAVVSATSTTTRDAAGSQKEQATSPLPSSLPAAPPIGKRQRKTSWNGSLGAVFADFSPLQYLGEHGNPLDSPQRSGW